MPSTRIHVLVAMWLGISLCTGALTKADLFISSEISHVYSSMRGGLALSSYTHHHALNTSHFTNMLKLI